MLTLAVLLGIFTVFFSAQEIRTNATNNLESRGQLLSNSRHIRDALRQGSTNLGRFLLDPKQSQYAEQSLAAFNRAHEYTHYLLEHDWLIGKTESTHLSRLPIIFNELLPAINHLVVSRKDPTKQYPALAIGNQNLRPNRNAFNNAMAIAINESNSEEQKSYFSEIFPELVKARYLWTQMVSNFRIYMANQLGSFNENVLTTQEQSIETLFHGLTLQLDKLREFDQQKNWGLKAVMP